MNIRKIAAAAMIAAAGVLATVTGAFAYDAAATTTLNVRSGPGTNFGVVGVLNSGQIVDVVECRGSWCRIEDRSVRGWASSSFLRDVSGSGPRPQPANPDVGFSVNTPGFSISIGSGNQRPGVTPPRPGFPAPPRGGEVCFFEDYDYRGRSFCARDGESARFLSRQWDDRIRSIRVQGRAEATVCTSPSLRGRCTTIDRSVRDLGRLSDDISSYSVDRI
jgi:uncharacterized protein YraI